MRLFKRKGPWVSLRYEEQFIPENYSEKGVERGAKFERHLATNQDLKTIFKATKSLDPKGIEDWLDEHMNQFEDTTFVVNTDSGASLDGLKPHHPELIINKMALTRIRHLNTFLNKANEALENGGYLWVHSRTARLKREVMLKAHPGFGGRVRYYLHYLWHRVLPKLKWTRWFYFWVTKGQNRTYHRVELLGRMYRAGFEVIDERFHRGEYYILGRKFRAPIWDDDPTCGPLVKLNRVGYHGKMIGVYKFRTMYSYSEYIQEYVYQHRRLDKTGKFYHDYRVNAIGAFLRKTWLDELPMVVNMLKGEMKLVGVRPLSQQFFNLYTPEMQELRIKTKPGLLPPLYYEKEQPETLEGIQESERRYIESYLKHPFVTDWKYFWGIVGNILLKRKHSH